MKKTKKEKVDRKALKKSIEEKKVAKEENKPIFKNATY